MSSSDAPVLEQSPAERVRRWNDRYPVGTPVAYYASQSLAGEPLERRKSETTRPARLYSGTAVVNIKGKPGPVPLTRIRPRRKVWVRVNRRGLVNHWVPLTADDLELEEQLAHLRATDKRVESVETRNQPPTE